MTGEIAGYDNNAGSILMRRQDGSTIAVPHEEVDDETHAAAFNAPRYVADERDRNQITSKRATLKQQREAAARPKPQAPRPQAAQPKQFFPPTKAAPTFGNNAPDQAHGGTLPPQLPKQPTPPAPPVRLTDNTGKYSFEGNVVGHDHENNVVTIVGADGRPRHVHTSRLGEGTMNYVRGLNLPHSPAPADRAKALQPQLRPGDQRFRLTDGQQVDGQITGHDPSTRTVNVRRPDGRVVSIDVDSLDEASRAHYDSRVNEHADRVQFDNEKKAYEKEHGPGSHRFRQGAVVHTGNGRSVLIPPGAKFGTDAATPEQGPIADAPPAARKVAEGVVATPPGQQEEGGRPGLPKREPGAAVDDQEQFRRNAAMRRADTQSRLRSGQGFANVEQQGPLEDTGLTDEIMRRRGEADAKDRGQMRDMVDAQNSQPQRRPSAPDADVRGQWNEAVQEYRSNLPTLKAKGVSLRDFAETMFPNADFSKHVPSKVMSGAQNAADKKHALDVGSATRTAQYRRSQMTPAAAKAAAERTVRDPNSSTEDRVVAFNTLGMEEAANTIVRGRAQEGVAKALPDDPGRAGGKPVPRHIDQVADAALAGVQAGATIAERQDAVASALTANDPTLTLEEAGPMAARRVQRHAWSKAEERGPESPEFQWVWRTANRLGENGEPTLDDNKKKRPPMGLDEFQRAAYANAGMDAGAAARLYYKVFPDKAPKARPGVTQIGTDDRPQVE
jgi:hypothetical protein